MAGALLNSGSLQQYTAIGDEGQPVYSVAAQLREAIRIKVGPEAAQCLATPRVNESRSSIDWYANQSGHVVAWSAATPQERDDALADLDHYHQRMLSTLQQLDGVSDRERRIMQNLLSKVFYFPNQDCVFLVDSKPVLTFWGFQHGVTSTPRDPFSSLRQAAPLNAAPVAATTEAVAKPRKWPWWLWLIGLLLLALLLFGLIKACTPQSTVATINGSSLASTSEPKVEVPAPVSTVTETSRTETAVDQGTTNLLKSEETVVIKDVSEALSGKGNQINGIIGTEKPLIPNDTALAKSATDVTANLESAKSADITNAPNGKQMQAEPAVKPTKDTGLNKQDSANATADTKDTKLPTGQPPAIDPKVQDARSQNSTQSQKANSKSTAVPPQLNPGMTNANSTLGKPMQIPTEAVKAGSVRFLDGNWQATGGLQDVQTGLPVSLKYQFDNGQGKVTIERASGVSCEANAKTTMNNGRLEISGASGEAKCSDGSTIALPDITCKPDASGQANCTGAGADGKPLPIVIRQSP